jgi:curved DNA-binding protein CbpA
MMTTLYEVLDVPPNCDAERLKEAFRKAVKVNHPDLNAEDPDATARLRLIVRAKTILSDPELRADYDRMLDFEQQPRRPFSSLAGGASHRFSQSLGNRITHLLVLA